MSHDVHAPSAKAEALADLLARLGRLLLGCGCPTPRLEAVIYLTAAARGYDAEVFVVPTGLWLSLSNRSQRPTVRMARVQNWPTDLNRLDQLDRVFNGVAAGTCSLEEAHRQLDEIEYMKPLYRLRWQWLAAGVASAAAGIFFGGGFKEATAAGLAGFICAIMSVGLVRSAQARFLVDFASGLVAGLVAWLASSMDPTLSRKAMVLGGMIVQIPGLTLTAGLSEIAQKNVVSGAGRLLDAGMVLLALTFGVGSVAAIELAIEPESLVQLIDAPRTNPIWAMALATLAVGGSFVVAFSAPLNAGLAVLVVSFVSWGATVLVVHLGFTGPAGAFLGALTLGLASNLYARRTQRPAQIVQVPGIILLVPGSLSLISIERIWWGEVGAGVSGMVQALVVAAALSIGLLLANATLPSRKVL